MTDKTNAGKPVDVKIENPDQASTNFYWTLDTDKGAFNFQTTIRGILKSDQISAHFTSAVFAARLVNEFGGVPKDLRDKYGSPAAKLPEAPSAKLPEPTPVDTVIAEVVKNDPVLTPAQPATQPATAQSAETFNTEKLAVTLSNNKKYFKVKGGPWAKYGVTVWDEVLVAAGIPVARLEAKEYDLPNYVATYVRKADGKPDKVTKLEKVA